MYSILIRFWDYNKWVDVVVDDRLPTCNGTPIATISKEKNEFWSALLEKAYAKFLGSYENLNGGTIGEALVDLTSGVNEFYQLKNAPESLFEIMKNGHERNSMMGCSIACDVIDDCELKTPEGLIRGHSYSITKVLFADLKDPAVKKKYRLLRLRNPWGDGTEWKGAFSDKAREWNLIPDHIKQEIELVFENDGEFWMTYEHFIKHFDRLEICNLSPDSLTEIEEKKKWNVKFFEGEWTVGVSAGGSRNHIDTYHRNPQYVLKLDQPDEFDDNDECTVVVSLMQKRRKIISDEKYLIIGFFVYKAREEDLIRKPLKKDFFEANCAVARSQFINLRENCSRFKLPPGHYFIIPSTFDPDYECEFIIRVFAENKKVFEENDELFGLKEVDERVTSKMSDDLIVDNILLDIFHVQKEIGWKELKLILDHFMKDGKCFYF
jgi:calpain, invertebrate